MGGCEREIGRLKGEKEKLEGVINEAVSTWKERDEAKNKLRKLYRELDNASTPYLYTESSPHINL